MKDIKSHTFVGYHMQLQGKSTIVYVYVPAAKIQNIGQTINEIWQKKTTEELQEARLRPVLI